MNIWKYSIPLAIREMKVKPPSRFAIMRKISSEKNNKWLVFAYRKKKIFLKLLEEMEISASFMGIIMKVLQGNKNRTIVWYTYPNCVDIP